MIHSVAGMLDGGRLVMRPPFREPHHCASQAALTGGGSGPSRARSALAHRGVLFLDELPEFPRQALEALRQPMEAGRTTVARAVAHVTYPARFQLVAAMNPCRCGHLGDAGRECGRAPRCGEDYQNRISGPLLDRIDLTIQVQPLAPAELSRAPPGEPTAAVAARVGRAREPSAAAAARPGRRSTPRPTSARSCWCPTRASWPRRRRTSCASRRAALPARCGWHAASPTSPAPTIRRADVAEALAYRHRAPGRAV